MRMSSCDCLDWHSSTESATNGWIRYASPSGNINCPTPQNQCKNLLTGGFFCIISCLGEACAAATEELLDDIEQLLALLLAPGVQCRLLRQPLREADLH